MRWFFKFIKLMLFIGGVTFLYSQATFLKGSDYVFKRFPTLAVYANPSENPPVSLSFMDQWFSNLLACNSVPVSCDAIQTVELDDDPNTRETLIMAGTDECEPYCSLWITIGKTSFHTDDDSWSWSSKMMSTSYMRSAKMPVTILDKHDKNFSRIQVTKKNGETVVYKYKLDKESFGSYN